MKLNAFLLTFLALTSVAKAAPASIPYACMNLALMQAELLQTRFYDNQMGEDAYQPAKLKLNATKSGLAVSKVEDLGGDSDESGKLPCSVGSDICTNPAGAGGAIDWAKVTVSDVATKSVVAEVIVSMGSRGGCSLSSAKVPANN